MTIYRGKNRLKNKILKGRSVPYLKFTFFYDDNIRSISNETYKYDNDYKSKHMICWI